MSSLSSDPGGPVQRFASSSTDNLWRGILAGLLPLVLLAAVAFVAIALTAVVRELAAVSGFFVQQQAALITLIFGLVLTIGVYAVTIVLTVRRIAIWQQEGATRQARAAVWMLGITALVVVLPLVLAIVLPQHPAP